jgi:hypothetical protein
MFPHRRVQAWGVPNPGKDCKLQICNLHFAICNCFEKAASVQLPWRPVEFANLISSHRPDDGRLACDFLGIIG